MHESLRSTWHELPTPPLCSLKPPRPPDNRRPLSPTLGFGSPQIKRSSSKCSRVRRKSQALGPINALPIPPSPPPSSTKTPVPLLILNMQSQCEDEEDEEIITLLGSPPTSPSQSRPTSPSPLPAPKACSASRADILEEIFEGVGGLVTEVGTGGSGTAGSGESTGSTGSGGSGAGTPSCCLRPISPPPKRGATATFLPGLVPLPGVLPSHSLPRPASLPAFLVPDRREDEGEQQDSALPPLVRARVLGSSKRPASPPSSAGRRPSSPPQRTRPSSTPTASHHRLSTEYRTFEAPSKPGPARKVVLPRPKEPKLEVPLWTVEEVASWVSRTGFQDYSPAFRECGVDGDMLLQLTDPEIRDDIGISNGILRKRFIRELNSLKKTADYSSCDGGLTANFLARVGSEYRGYAYSLIKGELSLDLMHRLSAADLEDMLKDCGVESAIHRHKIVEAVLNGTDDESFADSLYSEPVSWDVYISYPRQSGAELASLIKLQLETRGIEVFLDSHDSASLSERSLAQLRECRHLILVLPAGGLDSCMGKQGGEETEDLLHREIVAALAAGTKIIPVTADFQWPGVEELPEDIREIASFNSVRWVHDYQDACLDKLDRFIRGDLGSLKVDSPHSNRMARSRGDSGRSTPSSLLLPLSSSPTVPSPLLLQRFIKQRAVSIDSDLGSQST